MTIYGGFYHENCIIPKWNQIYGSAGRAAAILSNFTSTITLNTFSSNIEYLEFFSNAYKILLKSLVSKSPKFTQILKSLFLKKIKLILSTFSL